MSIAYVDSDDSQGAEKWHHLRPKPLPQHLGQHFTVSTSANGAAMGALVLAATVTIVPKMKISSRREDHPIWLRIAALAAVILIVVGFVVGFVAPGMVTGALLPLGLVLWLLVVLAAKKRDVYRVGGAARFE
tara:strand:+ start:1768 stop:2163 length:396 start_codon:yes stop_codon:yes gene_type:complete